MGIISRFKDIMSSNINAMLDKMEDPAKMVDQTLINLRKDLAQVKTETANIMADEKAAKRALDAATAEVDKYNAAAMNAVKAGNDDDARILLAKKQQATTALVDKQALYDVAKANADEMRQMHDKLVGDISSLEQRKDSIKAKVAVANAQEHINKINEGDKAASSISAFERSEAKANKMFGAAMAKAELNESPKDEAEDLAKQYSAGGSASVDDELATMKAALGK